MVLSDDVERIVGNQGEGLLPECIAGAESAKSCCGERVA